MAQKDHWGNISICGRDTHLMWWFLPEETMHIPEAQQPAVVQEKLGSCLLPSILTWSCSGHTSRASPKYRRAEPPAEWEPGLIPSLCSQHWGPDAHSCSGLLCAPAWRHSPSELCCGSGIAAPHCRWGRTELTSQPYPGTMPLCEKNIPVVLFLFFFSLQCSLLNWKLITEKTRGLFTPEWLFCLELWEMLPQSWSFAHSHKQSHWSQLKQQTYLSRANE